MFILCFLFSRSDVWLDKLFTWYWAWTAGSCRAREKFLEFFFALWLAGYCVYNRGQRHTQQNHWKIFYKSNIKFPNLLLSIYICLADGQLIHEIMYAKKNQILKVTAATFLYIAIFKVFISCSLFVVICNCVKLQKLIMLLGSLCFLIYIQNCRTN